jgi:site-specific recombinase XerD
MLDSVAIQRALAFASIHANASKLLSMPSTPLSRFAADLGVAFRTVEGYTNERRSSLYDPLRKRMLEELQLRNLSQNTITAYIGAVRRYTLHFGKPPEQLGPEHVRRYLLYLLNEKEDTANTIQVYRGALKFLYLQVLKQSWFDEEIAAPKQRLRLPTILRPDEIARILDRTINREHWMILATFYATALRCCELRRLKIDIDSRQMIVHVREGKGSVPRILALPPNLLERLTVGSTFVLGEGPHPGALAK